MPLLLRLDSSADLVTSRSRAITDAFADAWTGVGPDHRITTRDLHRSPVPHLADASLHWAPHLRAAGDAPPVAAQQLQDALIAELVAADVLVIGAPLYNYSLPSSLKAWLDHIHVLGTTAPFGDGVQPMAGRPAVIAVSRGATYDPGTPTEGFDHARPVFELVLGNALGMTLTFVTVDGTLADRIPAMAGDVGRRQAELVAAREQAADLARQLG